jgi:hypothetical protein
MFARHGPMTLTEVIGRMINGSDIEMASPMFVRHLAARLVSERRRARRPLWLMATRSKGRFTTRDLRDAEAGVLPLDADTVTMLAEVYCVPLDDLLPTTRRGLDIRADGLISAGGVTLSFIPGDSRSLVGAYFKLARTLRDIDDQAALPLRRADVEAIDAFLRQSSPPSDLLAPILAMVDAERQVMVASIIAGAAAIGLAGITENSIPSIA